MAIQPPPPKLWAPYREGAREEAVTIAIPGARARILHSTWWDGGLLTDFLVLQQVDIGRSDQPEWTDIVRVDCCHQEVHSHRLYADPDVVYRVIKKIETPEDLQAGAEEAESHVYDEMDEHLRRWEHGRSR